MNESALKVILELGPKYGVNLWKHVQWLKYEGAWQNCDYAGDFDPTDGCEYRVIRHVHRVNGIECQAPMSEKPKDGDMYYFYSTTNPSDGGISKWDGCDLDEYRLRIGNCFYSESGMLENFYAHYPHMRPESE